jgi:hypothetical protein
VQPPGARKPQGYEVDLCADCAKVYDDMVAFLGEYARREGSEALITPASSPGGKGSDDAASESRDERTCPLCEHVTPRVSGLQSHVKNEHGITLSEARGEAYVPCPERGCERMFGGVQGMAAHMRTVHNRAVTDDERREARKATPAAA